MARPTLGERAGTAAPSWPSDVHRHAIEGQPVAGRQPACRHVGRGRARPGTPHRPVPHPASRSRRSPRRGIAARSIASPATWSSWGCVRTTRSRRRSQAGTCRSSTVSSRSGSGPLSSRMRPPRGPSTRMASPWPTSSTVTVRRPGPPLRPTTTPRPPEHHDGREIRPPVHRRLVPRDRRSTGCLSACAAVRPSCPGTGGLVRVAATHARARRPQPLPVPTGRQERWPARAAARRSPGAPGRGCPRPRPWHPGPASPAARTACPRPDGIPTPTTSPATSATVPTSIAGATMRRDEQVGQRRYQ